MKKRIILGAAVGLICLLAGCSGFSPDESGVSVDKDGVVTGVAVERLDKDYYDQNELKTMVDSSVSAYVKTAGEDSVKLKKLDVDEKDAQAKLVMEYASPKDYAEFNKVKFYAGTLIDAEQAGFPLEGSFKSVEKGEVVKTGIPAKEVMTKDYQVIVLEEPILVKVPGSIVFVSDNVDVNSKNEAKFLSENEKETQTVSETAGSETQKQTQNQTTASGETELLMISPEEVKDSSEIPGMDDSAAIGTKLAYIIYE